LHDRQLEPRASERAKAPARIARSFALLVTSAAIAGAFAVFLLAIGPLGVDRRNRQGR
jgi:hypothetical protein